jgi:hypothetical protein
VLGTGAADPFARTFHLRAEARECEVVRAQKSSRYTMNTKSDPGRHLTDESRDQLKLMLYAAASALLPYVAATLLIVVGQSL